MRIEMARHLSLLYFAYFLGGVPIDGQELDEACLILDSFQTQTSPSNTTPSPFPQPKTSSQLKSLPELHTPPPAPRPPHINSRCQAPGSGIGIANRS